MTSTPTAESLTRLVDAILDPAPVSQGSRRTNSPHEFYRYPARFPPAVARAAIEAFSERDGLIIDPFVGGGTTAVEAVRSGRAALVSDINPLATFVTGVKVRRLGDASAAAVRDWIKNVPQAMSLSDPEPVLDDWAAAGYFKDLRRPDTWRIRKLVAQALAWLPPQSDASDFCRCVVLRTAQWALDMRDALPSAPLFRRTLVENGQAMLAASIAFWGSGAWPTVEIVTSGLPGLGAMVGGRLDPPCTVVTSPPYPGVYVNYHRWKLQGRREIPAPYWIANKLDGRGISHYTMGARADSTQNRYFATLKSAFADLVSILPDGSTVVQIVGFNNVATQLPRYLEVMGQVGLQELFPEGLATGSDERLWRPVPGRRWWTSTDSRRDVAPETAKEVVLVHQVGG